MAIEFAGTYLQLSQPPLSQSHLSPKTLGFAFSRNAPDLSIAYHIAQQSCFHGNAFIHHSNRRRRARGGRRTVRPSYSASLDGFLDDSEDDAGELVKRRKELALKFKLEIDSGRNEVAEITNSGEESASCTSPVFDSEFPSSFSIISEIRALPLDQWPSSVGFIPDKVELRANSFDFPLSLRILKWEKNRWESPDMTDSAYSSVKKAFFSMLFIVRELQIHMIRMREALFSLSNIQIQGILDSVQGELHASFVWLFQHIFSATPTLMVYLMLLLANFAVFSITDYPVIAKPLAQSVSAIVEESPNPTHQIDSSALKSLSIGRPVAIGGSGDRGKAQSLAGDGRWDRSSSSFLNRGTIFLELVSAPSAEEEDARAWKMIADEVERIRGSGRHEALMDPDTSGQFLSPVIIELEQDDFSAYAATELSYRRSLAEDPNDPLLLSNYAQFLYLVLHDHDRAEEYFKRSARAEPADAEALSRYANFLWVARKDLGAAEENFLEAIERDPGNSYYSANYANFLWSTGGEDTCYPLDACVA